MQTNTTSYAFVLLALGTLVTLNMAVPIAVNAADLELTGGQPTVVRSLDTGHHFGVNPWIPDRIYGRG